MKQPKSSEKTMEALAFLGVAWLKTTDTDEPPMEEPLGPRRLPTPLDVLSDRHSSGYTEL